MPEARLQRTREAYHVSIVRLARDEEKAAFRPRDTSAPPLLFSIELPGVHYRIGDLDAQDDAELTRFEMLTLAGRCLTPALSCKIAE